MHGDVAVIAGFTQAARKNHVNLSSVILQRNVLNFNSEPTLISSVLGEKNSRLKCAKILCLFSAAFWERPQSNSAFL